MTESSVLKSERRSVSVFSQLKRSNNRVPSLRGEYLNLYKNVAGAIRNGEELKVKWIEAAEVIEMINLTYKSCKEGKTLSVPSLRVE